MKNSLQMQQKYIFYHKPYPSVETIILNVGSVLFMADTIAHF